MRCGEMITPCNKVRIFFTILHDSSIYLVCGSFHFFTPAIAQRRRDGGRAPDSKWPKVGRRVVALGVSSEVVANTWDLRRLSQATGGAAPCRTRHYPSSYLILTPNDTSLRVLMDPLIPFLLMPLMSLMPLISLQMLPTHPSHLPPKRRMPRLAIPIQIQIIFHSPKGYESACQPCQSYLVMALVMLVMTSSSPTFQFT